MKKTTLIYTVLILILAAVSVWMMRDNDQKSTLEDLKEEYRFYVEDTAAVDKIVLTDKSPSTVELTRVNGVWMVDGKHPAREDAIETLLLTLNRMQLRNFIPERMKETVLKRMSVYGTTVEVYLNGTLEKTIIVGTDAQDEMGTYMMLEGASAPYAVHIPGFNGFLSTRFFTEPYLWYKRIITDMDPGSIRKVRLTYPDSIEKSFVLDLENAENISIQNPATGEVKAVNMNKLMPFILSVSRMRYEGAIIPSDGIYARRDSLLASQPVFDLTVTSEVETVNLKAYKIKGPEEAYDPDSEAPEYDPDRLHAFINEDQMVLVQYYSLQQVLISMNDLSLL